MNTFKKKWNGKSVEDWGAYMSKEGKSFVTAFKNMLKRELSADGIEVVDFHAGHYDLSGFCKKGDRYIYVSYSIPRGGMPIRFDNSSCMNGVLYRTAKDNKDWHGGHNNFSDINNLPEAIRALFDRASLKGEWI